MPEWEFLAEVASRADCPTLAFAPVSSMTLVALSHDVDELWARIEEGGAPGSGPSGARTVAVWRRDIVVYHRTLAPDEAELLAQVMRGRAFAELCAAAAGFAAQEQAAARAAELLLSWIQATILRAPGGDDHPNPDALERPTPMSRLIELSRRTLDPPAPLAAPAGSEPVA